MTRQRLSKRRQLLLLACVFAGLFLMRRWSSCAYSRIAARSGTDD
jgi:hypothetical protein